MKDEKRPRKVDAGDYEVGYGKPPKHTRFQKGRSGNPKGRSKGTKNLKTDFIEELGEQIRVREGEKTRHVSKQRAMVKAVVARALRGDVRSLALVLSTTMRLIDPELADGVAEPLHEHEREILSAFEARLRRADPDASAAPNGAEPDPAGETS